MVNAVAGSLAFARRVLPLSQYAWGFAVSDSTAVNERSAGWVVTAAAFVGIAGVVFVLGHGALPGVGLIRLVVIVVISLAAGGFGAARVRAARSRSSSRRSATQSTVALSEVAQDIVADALTRGMQILERRDFIKTSRNAWQILGKAMVPMIKDSDTGVLFFPVAVRVEGKDQIGAALVLQDRFLLASITGKFGAQPVATEVRFDEITDITRSENRGQYVSTLSGDGRKWVLSWPPIMNGEGFALGMFEGSLNGSVAFKEE